jgi:hypothetical protein
MELKGCFQNTLSEHQMIIKVNYGQQERSQKAYQAGKTGAGYAGTEKLLEVPAVVVKGAEIQPAPYTERVRQLPQARWAL